MRRHLFNSCRALLLLLLPSLLEAKTTTTPESSEKSFYAISSLRYHIQELDQSDATSTVFDEQDIHSLWKSALSGASQSSQIYTAKQLYDEAKTAVQPNNSSQLYRRAKDALKQAWLELHPFTSTSRLESRSITKTNVGKNQCITRAMNKQIKPYLLPADHSLKPALDSLFSVYGVNQDGATMSKSGFITVSVRPFSFLVVVKHPMLPRHLLKVYLESEERSRKGTPGWQWLVQRCQGAQNIRELIKRKNLTSFVVPDKWLYPLPQRSDKAHGNCSQPVVLMVSDMDLVSQEESNMIWKKRVTHKVLNELFVILSHGFASCHVAWNIPPTKSGKFACIDTEHPKRKLHYKLVKQYLSDDMAKYWDWLIRKGGKH